MLTLERFAEGLWISNGPVVSSFGFRYPTRMAVIRLEDGELFVWSPVALTDDLRRAVDALGPVRHIIAPNSLHYLFVTSWKDAFPMASTYAAPGLPEKRTDFVFDQVLSDGAPAAWSGQIDQNVVRGNLITTEVVFFHRTSGTVIFTDLLQTFKPGWFTGWRAAIAWLDGMIGSVPQMPRKFRLAFTDRPAARASLGRILEWPIERVVMAHGEPVVSGGKAHVKRAFSWLLPAHRKTKD